MFLKILLLLLLSTNLFASYSDAQRMYDGGALTEKNLKNIINELMDEGFYYSSIPWLKEHIAVKNGKISSEMDELLDELISHVGIEQFESMPVDMLSRSSSSTVKFILAKKKLNAKDYADALNIVNGISDRSLIYPFALQLRGVAQSLLEKHDEAIKSFEECAEVSDKLKNKFKGDREAQLIVNRDSCTAGVARALFAKKEYQKADLKYLDVPKSSMIWPDILFEEAWNSFYLGNYNRTLGKLVTYKAPLLDFIFNPEIDVLRGYTYLKLCLYDDAKKNADEFYNVYMEPARELRMLINENKSNNEFFYKIGFGVVSNKTSNVLFNRMMLSITRDPAFKGIKLGLHEATNEYQALKGKNNTKFKNSLLRNLSDVLTVQRNIFGGYIKKQMISKYANLYRAFQYMSYMKLEVISQKKAELYAPVSNENQKRGDIKYLKRNDKQYFWTFNGEFWADELGDYVFALRSECRE